MNVKKCKIDSINLSYTALESIFFYDDNYIIEDIKTKSIFKPKIWSKSFGKALTKNIIEAKIIHNYLGLKIPLKRYSVSPKYQTIEFAGLNGYNERSKLLLQTYKDLKNKLSYARVTRIDIAIDFKYKIPNKIISYLIKKRKAFNYGNTTYYKTPKEKKSNQKMDIKIYNKQKQAKLNYPLYRIEFVFKSAYLNKLFLKDIESIYIKMEKSIKKAIGVTVKIEHI